MRQTRRRPAAVLRAGTARIGIIAIAVLACLLGLSTEPARAESAGIIHAVAGTAQGSLLTDGLSHTAYVTAQAADGSVEESAHASSDEGSPALSIIDVDAYSAASAGLTAVVELTNTTDSPLTVNETVRLPTESGVSQLHVSGAPEGATSGGDGQGQAESPDPTGTGEAVEESTTETSAEAGPTATDGSASADSADSADSSAASPSGTPEDQAREMTLTYNGSSERPTDWSGLQQIGLTGTLAPGADYSLRVPLTLSSTDGLDLDGAHWAELREELRSPGVASSSTKIRFARRVWAGDGTDPLSTTGRYRASSNAPESIQSLMPTASPSDLTIIPATGSPHAAADGETLFTGDKVSLNLSRIKMALRDTGWQVETSQDTSDGLAAEHLFTSEDLRSGPGGGALGGAAVPVRQVISATSSTIPVGSTWSPGDNLGWIHDHSGADVAVDSADVHVTSTVDTSTPGIYEVTYSYAPQAYTGQGDYESSVTVEVAVTGSSTTIAGTTTLEGGDLEEGQFTFALTNASGEQVATTTNHADGSFSFAAPQPGSASADTTQEYTITEVVPEDAVSGPDGAPVSNGIIYDTHTERVQLRISADASGTNPVVASVTPDADGVLFTNIVDTTSPSPTPSPQASPGISPEPDAPEGAGSGSGGDDQDGSISLISDESSMLAMGTGAVMVTVGTVMGLHSNRR